MKHPNIVRLYDVIETDKYIGIILEYASGGELFDHILAHRYLKEKDAAKLFSQLISGVWYIHQKKIVHRDLKLENLLLDRNRNVIITDFGFANRFEHRADDLMQTSCGSPCYAAPELVISEGLYVGSAVDIWSCGVILYAMLAGYLPFDDDPANPDGDNINLLYKYIVNTPLSFPDYVSTEARDLLSMMLVPDPTRRADLRSIMAHPWLSAYVHIFTNGVDDLERAAMEQHQMKRMAYQRQMRQAAAAPSEPSRVARTQSARVDGMLNVSTSSTAPRSHSYRDNLPAGQPEYLYETSVDQSIYSSSPTAPHSRNAVSLAVTPATSTGPADDDPFAPTINIPVTISLPDEGPSVTPNIQDIDSSYPPNGSAKSPTDTGKKKAAGGFRHTIQVEYPGDPHPQVQAPGSSHGKASRADTSSTRPSSKQGVESRDRVVSGSRTTPRTPGEKVTVVPAVDAEMSPPKPLPAPPATPTPSRVDTTHLTPSAALRENQPQTPSVAISPASPSPTPNGEDKSFKSIQGSTGSGSSRHRKGLSVDKFGLGKIFGTNGDQAAANGTRSRVPSESSAAGTPVAEEKRASSTITSTNDTAKNALLSPVSPSPTNSAKKNRRNTLTVMVEPFSRTIKSRKGKTPVGETPSKDNRDLEKQLPPSSTDSPSQTNRGTVFPSVAKDGHQTHDMPASTTKARNVMQWFRRRSNAKPDGEDSPDSRAMRAGTDLSLQPQIPTPSSKTELDRNGNQGRSAGDTSFSFSKAGWKFNASTPTTKDVLRIHHGAVDQTTITTRPPPEVIKHVCKVLEEMGMDIKAESEYKYRCVRAKRRKSGGTVGLGFSTVGSGSGLAAFTMVGSAASNGVSRSSCRSEVADDSGCRSINAVFLSHLIPPLVACLRVSLCEGSHLRFLGWLLHTLRCPLMMRTPQRHLRR